MSSLLLLGFPSHPPLLCSGSQGARILRFGSDTTLVGDCKMTGKKPKVLLPSPGPPWTLIESKGKGQVEAPIAFVSTPKHLRVTKQANKLLNQAYSVLRSHQLCLPINSEGQINSGRPMPGPTHRESGLDSCLHPHPGLSLAWPLACCLLHVTFDAHILTLLDFRPAPQDSYHHPHFTDDWGTEMLDTFAQSYGPIRTQAEVQLSFNVDNYTICSPGLISSLIIYIFHLYFIITSLSKSPNSIPFAPNSCPWLPQALGLLESSLDVGARAGGGQRPAWSLGLGSGHQDKESSLVWSRCAGFEAIGKLPEPHPLVPPGPEWRAHRWRRLQRALKCSCADAGVGLPALA